MRFPVPALRSLLAALTGSRLLSAPVRRRKNALSNPLVDCLEPRQLLSADHLAFGSVPATGFLGSTLGQVVVNIDDAGGQLVTNDNSRIKLTVATGPNAGKVLGIANAIAGAATFNNIRLPQLGTYTLTATDISESSVSAAPPATVLIEAAPTLTSLTISTPSDNFTGSQVSTVTVTLMDQYSHSFTGGHAMIALALVDPAAGAKLLGKLSASAVNGIATFTGLSTNEQGTFQLRATEGAGSHSLAMTTQSFSVAAPAVATSLVFGHDVTNVAAGADMGPPVTVKVEDQYGNVITTDRSVIKLATVPGAPQSKTFTAHVVNGVATFSAISFDQAGTYTLKATDARTTDGHSLSLTDLNSFTVSAAAADHLVFQQIPATNTAHAGPFTISAAIEDKFGNVVTSNTSTVTLGLASGPSGATLNLTAQATTGVATFTSVIFPSAGHYRLKATDSALKPANSATFTLT